MATIHAAAFWVMRYFSVGLRLTRPFVIAEAADSRVVRKEGAAAISAFCIAVAMAPSGGIVFARISEAFIVAATKFRKAVFH